LTNSETLVPQGKAGFIPVKYLQFISFLVAENKHGVT